MTHRLPQDPLGQLAETAPRATSPDEGNSPSHSEPNQARSIGRWPQDRIRRANQLTSKDFDETVSSLAESAESETAKAEIQTLRIRAHRAPLGTDPTGYLPLGAYLRHSVCGHLRG